MKIVMTMNREDYLGTVRNGYTGICIACGEMHDGVEPDADGYYCDACEENAVMGLEQAMLCGYVGVIDAR